MEPTDQLPPLTPDQSTAIGYLLTSTLSLQETADEAGMTLGQFVMTLMHPACQAHIEAVTHIHDQRAKARAAEARTKAIDTLEFIAENASPPTDKLELLHRMERRRAAASILRFGANPAPRRRPDRDPDPSDTHPATPSPQSEPLTLLTTSLGLAATPLDDLHPADVAETKPAHDISIPEITTPNANSTFTPTTDNAVNRRLSTSPERELRGQEPFAGQSSPPHGVAPTGIRMLGSRAPEPRAPERAMALPLPQHPRPDHNHASDNPPQPHNPRPASSRPSQSTPPQRAPP